MHGDVFRSCGCGNKSLRLVAPAATLLPCLLPCLREAALAAEQRRHARKGLVSAAGVSRAGART